MLLAAVSRFLRPARERKATVATNASAGCAGKDGRKMAGVPEAGRAGDVAAVSSNNICLFFHYNLSRGPQFVFHYPLSYDETEPISLLHRQADQDALCDLLPSMGTTQMSKDSSLALDDFGELQHEAALKANLQIPHSAAARGAFQSGSRKARRGSADAAEHTLSVRCRPDQIYSPPRRQTA